MTVIRGLKDAPSGSGVLRERPPGVKVGEGLPVPSSDVKPQGESGEWVQQLAWAIEDGSLEWATYYFRWIMQTGEVWAQAQAQELGLERLRQAPDGKGSAAALVRLYHHFGPLFPRGHSFHEAFLERLEQRVRVMTPGPAALTVTGAIDRALEYFQRGLETYPAYAGLSEAMRDLKSASHRAAQKEKEQELESAIATGDYNRALELCRTLIETYRSPLASGLMPSILAQLGSRGVLEGGEGAVRRSREWGWPDGQEGGGRSGHLRMVKTEVKGEDGEASDVRLPKTPWGRAFDAPSDRAISEARLKRSAEKSAQILQMPRRDDPVSIPDAQGPETDSARAGGVSVSAAPALPSNLDSAAQPIGLENLRKPGRTDEQSRLDGKPEVSSDKPASEPATGKGIERPALEGDARSAASQAEASGSGRAGSSAASSGPKAPVAPDVPSKQDAQAADPGEGAEDSSSSGEFRPAVEVRSVRAPSGTSTGRLGREREVEKSAGGGRRPWIWLLILLVVLGILVGVAWVLGWIPGAQTDMPGTPVAASTQVPEVQATPAVPKPPPFVPPSGPPGTLSLEILPDDKLEMYLDGEFQPDGKVTSRTLPSGTHLLEIYREGYERLSQELVTTAGSDTRLQVTLQKSPSISLEVQPGGEDLAILLNGRRVTARAPLKGYVIPPGKHTLEVRRDGYVPYKEEFQAMPAAALQFKVNLAPLGLTGP